MLQTTLPPERSPLAVAVPIAICEEPGVDPGAGAITGHEFARIVNHHTDVQMLNSPRSLLVRPRNHQQ